MEDIIPFEKMEVETKFASIVFLKEADKKKIDEFVINNDGILMVSQRFNNVHVETDCLFYGKNSGFIWIPDVFIEDYPKLKEIVNEHLFQEWVKRRDIVEIEGEYAARKICFYGLSKSEYEQIDRFIENL